MSDLTQCRCTGDDQHCGFDTSAGYVNHTAYEARQPYMHVPTPSYRWCPGDPIYPPRCTCTVPPSGPEHAAITSADCPEHGPGLAAIRNGDHK